MEVEKTFPRTMCNYLKLVMKKIKPENTYSLACDTPITENPEEKALGRGTTEGRVRKHQDTKISWSEKRACLEHMVYKLSSHSD